MPVTATAASVTATPPDSRPRDQRMSRSRRSPLVVSGDESPYDRLRAWSSSCAMVASSGSVGVAKVRKTVPPHVSHVTEAGSAAWLDFLLLQFRQTCVMSLE